MKRIVSRQEWRAVPDLSVEPIKDWSTYVRSRASVSVLGTFSVPGTHVEGGFVPLKTTGPFTVQEEEEYLSAGELRAALEGVPDEAPVEVYDGDSDSWDDAVSVEWDGKVVRIN